jgi:hypothetical protein
VVGPGAAAVEAVECGRVLARAALDTGGAQHPAGRRGVLRRGREQTGVYGRRQAIKVRGADRRPVDSVGRLGAGDGVAEPGQP